jgi:hypothetical protein
LLPKKIIPAAHFCCQKSNFAAQKNKNVAAQKNNFAAQSNKFAAHFTNSHFFSSLYFRALASKSLMARNLQFCRINPHLHGASSRSVILKVYPAPDPLKETLDEKAVRMKFPQSPHLSVYKLEFPMLLSGTHR